MKPTIHPFFSRIFILAGLVSLCYTMQAQDGSGNDKQGDRISHHRPGGEERGARFSDRRGHGWEGRPRLHYSPEQQKQLQAINKEYRAKQQDLFANDKMSLGEYKSKLLALQKEKKSRTQDLLTAEQKEKLAQWKKQAAENAQVRAAAHLERMKIRLKLSDEQAATLKSRQADLHAKMQSIRENDNLLPRQKMEEIKALFAQREGALKSVLTPEQLSAFQSMHHRHWRGEGEQERRQDLQ